MDGARRAMHGPAVFDLLFDGRHVVLMSRFHGRYVAADITVRDNAVARFVARHGLARGIMDFSAVETIDVPMDFVLARCEAPPLLPGRTRVIVAPSEPAYSLNRVIAAHQLYNRKVEPLLVGTLADAYRALDIDKPAFEPVELDEATRLELAAFDALADIERTLAPAVAEREKMQRAMLRRLDSALAAGGTPSGSATRTGITLADVLNAQLHRAKLSDADLTARCDSCRRKLALAACRVTPGRETIYACPHCGHLLLVLGADCDPAGSYRLGRFSLRAYADIECPGGRLPRSAVPAPSPP
jgi:hypothetical protein